MKYYEICIKDSGINNDKLAMAIVNKDETFNSENSEISFLTHEIDINIPIKIKALFYKKIDIEEDFVSAGNPQVVSEDFKKLVEELDPNAAQFFETESINCITIKKYYVMHVIKCISCLDRRKSKIISIPSSESIAVGMIDISKLTEKDHIFRLAEDPLFHYVSEVFYMEYKKRKLSGCEFYLRS